MQRLFETATHVARELSTAELPELQALFEANPEYFIAVTGEPPCPSEARNEFEEEPPSHIQHGRRWFLGLFNASSDLQGVCIVVRDLGATGVWHIALYLWASQLHGSGIARDMHAALETWALRSGALWLRLGVVVGNHRAERFWEKIGYSEVRRREGVPTGRRNNEVRVMVKPLLGQPLSVYTELVPRDRPGSTLA
jgi:RimJ/RimL family protein N-acetyltransferase